LGAILLFIVLPALWIQLEPSLRQTHAVDIIILDESQQPVPDATLAFQEFEVVPIIPLMPFGPARKILNDRTVITDKQGKAHFGVKYYTTVANSVSRAGTKLKVAYSETIDSYDGKPRRSFPEQLPQWHVGHGFADRHWQSTIVVRP
jgi:hypothetical protein